MKISLCASNLNITSIKLINLVTITTAVTQPWQIVAQLWTLSITNPITLGQTPNLSPTSEPTRRLREPIPELLHEKIITKMGPEVMGSEMGPREPETASKVLTCLERSWWAEMAARAVRQTRSVLAGAVIVAPCHLQVIIIDFTWVGFIFK